MALALDGSAPVSVFTNGTSSTTASFTPPAGALLVIAMRYNTGTGDTPGTPTITDSLGSHLTYTLREHDRRPDAPLAESAVAVWTAVATGAALAITTGSSGTAATGNALKVQVWTDGASTPGVGTVVKNSSITGTSSITQNVLCTVTGANAIIAFSNWDASGIPTGGTGCTTTGGDGADQGATLAYALISRTANDGVASSNISMQVNSIGGGANLRWVAMEIVPGVPAGDTTPPSIPTNLAANTITAATAGLTWTASTDNTAVTGYDIEIVGP